MVSGSTSVVDLVIENTKDLTVNVDGSGQVIEAVSSTPDVVPQAASISVADDDQVNNSDIKHEEVNVSWISVYVGIIQCLFFTGRTICCCK